LQAVEQRCCRRVTASIHEGRYTVACSDPDRLGRSTSTVRLRGKVTRCAGLRCAHIFQQGVTLLHTQMGWMTPALLRHSRLQSGRENTAPTTATTMRKPTIRSRVYPEKPMGINRTTRKTRITAATSPLGRKSPRPAFVLATNALHNEEHGRQPKNPHTTAPSCAGGVQRRSGLTARVHRSLRRGPPAMRPTKYEGVALVRSHEGYLCPTERWPSPERCLGISERCCAVPMRPECSPKLTTIERTVGKFGSI